ncbi:hypothetical protein L1049_027188 [Liquidambar formosana]|uniref:At1g68980-like TPR repeats domain-containing protein n=1 Tax=Liquidambar formosana TaxID=63359 RepID=A0AAP0N9A5_LIQFO
MALSLTREILVHSRFIRSSSSRGRVVSTIQTATLRSVSDREFILSNSSPTLLVSGAFHKQYQNPSLQQFSTTIKPERISWEGSSHAVLLRKLENALKDHQVDEAWEAFNDFKSLYGFPEHSLVSRLVTELSYSSNSHWLQKACDLVFLIVKEKSNLLQHGLLTTLSLSLARAQLPVPASMILRLMLEKESVPSMNVLCLVVLHMVKTDIGTYLASNILVEICDCFQHLSENRANRAKQIRPDTMIFNLVLDACVRFGSSLKGQQLIELMPRIGVIADAQSIVIIARIHEMNGQRDEIKKFKDHIDRILIPLVRHYRQFYDSLLSLHFKFNDIEAAARLALDMCRIRKSLPNQKDNKDPQKPCLVAIASHNLKAGLKIHIVPELLQKDSVLKVESKQELVIFRNAKLVLSNRALAKLINGYKKVGKISELSWILITIQKGLGSLKEASLCSDVIDACIHLGWLETAHDILDDIELAGVPMGLITYMSLLTAYYKGRMFREAKALLRQMRKADLALDMSDEMLVSTCRSEVYTKASSSIQISDLAECLVWEMREEEQAIPPLAYELNSSMYFFCKAKMIGDALKTYRRIQEMKIQPTVQTFAYLVHGYSSMEMYREITILWGDIKRNMESGNLVISRDLFELLLLNFLRGGYFERVMEVVDHLRQRNMYTDKWMYKREFLKFHKDLYRNLKASKARTEAQSKRVEFVRAFRKWVGID